MLDEAFGLKKILTNSNENFGVQGALTLGDFDVSECELGAGDAADTVSPAASLVAFLF